MPAFNLRSVALLALFLSACTKAPANLEAHRSALMQTSRDWAAAAASGDIERIAAFWADDAVVLPPDEPAVVGKEAIRAFLAQSMKIPGFTITWEPESATISESGDVGYLVEHNRVTFTDSTGVTHTQFGKAVTIWKRNEKGEWKCVVDTWNNSPSETVLPKAT